MKQNSIKPAALHIGDTVAALAIAGPPVLSRLEQGVAFLSQLGLRVVVGKTVTQRRGYLAGEDHFRAEEFNHFIADPLVRALFVVRGGYGSMRILPLIRYNLLRKNPKIIIGYSDITALLLALFKRTGLISLHGPMLAVDLNSDLPDAAKNQLIRLLFKSDIPELLFSASDPDWHVVRTGSATGPLIGGCLSIIVTLLGTRYMPDLHGAILFFEDVHESPYRIDRMLHHLKSAGVFSKVAGVLIGSMRDCVPTDQEPSLTLDEIYGDIFSNFYGPVVSGMPFGHNSLTFTLPVGVNACLNSEEGFFLRESVTTENP